MGFSDVSYSCGQCGFALNLSSSDRLISRIGPSYPKWSRKGILYFLSIDESRFRMSDEVKWGPYFETPKKWGLQRMRTKLLCRKCGNLIGYVQIGPSSAFACFNVKTLDDSEHRSTNKFCVNIRALQPAVEKEEASEHQGEGESDGVATSREELSS